MTYFHDYYYDLSSNTDHLETPFLGACDDSCDSLSDSSDGSIDDSIIDPSPPNPSARFSAFLRGMAVSRPLAITTPPLPNSALLTKCVPSVLRGGCTLIFNRKALLIPNLSPPLLPKPTAALRRSDFLWSLLVRHLLGIPIVSGGIAVYHDRRHRSDRLATATAIESSVLVDVVGHAAFQAFAAALPSFVDAEPVALRRAFALAAERRLLQLHVSLFRIRGLAQSIDNIITSSGPTITSNHAAHRLHTSMDNLRLPLDDISIHRVAKNVRQYGRHIVDSWREMLVRFRDTWRHHHCVAPDIGGGGPSLRVSEPPRCGRITVAVCGDASFRRDSSRMMAKKISFAFHLGVLLARAGYSLVTGGCGGVPGEACRGFCSIPRGDRSGLSIGVLPCADHPRSVDSRYIEASVATALGPHRNGVVASAEYVVVVGGGAGTLNEASLAWLLGRPVVAAVGVAGVGCRLASQPMDSRHRESVIFDSSVLSIVHAAYRPEDCLSLLGWFSERGGSVPRGPLDRGTWRATDDADMRWSTSEPTGNMCRRFVGKSRRETLLVYVSPAQDQLTPYIRAIGRAYPETVAHIGTIELPDHTSFRHGLVLSLPPDVSVLSWAAVPHRYTRLSLWCAIANEVAHLHRLGIAHRSLLPDAVLWRPSLAPTTPPCGAAPRPRPPPPLPPVTLIEMGQSLCFTGADEQSTRAACAVLDRPSIGALLLEAFYGFDIARSSAVAGDMHPRLSRARLLLEESGKDNSDVLPSSIATAARSLMFGTVGACVPSIVREMQSHLSSTESYSSNNDSDSRSST